MRTRRAVFDREWRAHAGPPEKPQYGRAEARNRILRRALAGFVLAAVSVGCATRAEVALRTPMGPPVVTATIQLEPGLSDIETGFGSVWVASPVSVIRIDPSSNLVVATIPLAGGPDAVDLAVGEGAVWAVSGPRAIARIDPSTNKVVATIGGGGFHIEGMAAGGGGLWVTRLSDASPRGALVYVDADTNQITGDPILVGRGPGPVSYTGVSVWVTNTDSGGSLMRVDPLTRYVTLTLNELIGFGDDGFGSFWLASGDSVYRLEPITGITVATVRLTRAAQVAVGEGAVWVLSASGSTDPDPMNPIQRSRPRSAGSILSPIKSGKRHLR